MPITYDDRYVLRPGHQVEFTREMVMELQKCAIDIIYFAENYFTIVHPTKGKMIISLYDFQKDMISMFSGNKRSIVMSARQVGKALSLDTPILTDRGWSNMKDINEGDYIYGQDGNKTKVTFITDVMKNKDVYKITFDNGEEIKCCDEHLWSVNHNNVKKVLSTKNLLSIYKQISIKSCKKISNEILPSNIIKEVNDIISSNPNYIKIQKIEKIESEPVRCLQVDNEDHLFLCGKGLIPTHNTTCSCIYLLWYSIFNADKDVAILANKQSTAGSIISDIKEAYEQLPAWMKPGVKKYDNLTIVFDNGTKIYARATSPDALRGESVSLMFLDEFAFVPENIAEDFWASQQPTLSTGGSVIIVSTPNGTAGLFYKLWKQSERKESEWANLRITWDRHPDRDEEWKEATIKDIGKVKFQQEHNCLGANTKIKVRDCRNIETKEVTLKKLYEEISKNGELVKNNINYEILTPTGWESFMGIQQIPNKEVVKIFLSDNSEITCTSDHKFVMDGKDVTCCNLKIGDYLDCVSDKKLKVVKKVHLFDMENVFDIVSVNNISNHFLVNDKLITHNCSFTGSSYTLIDGDVLEKLQAKEPSYYTEEGYYMWKKPIPGHLYMAGIDVAKGANSDYHVINIYDVTNFFKTGRYEQVALYRRNDISVFDFQVKAVEICKVWNEAVAIVENNDLGHVVVHNMYFEDGYENTWYDYDKGEYGIRSSPKTKPIAISHFKEDVEGGKQVINSEDMITELSYYEEIRTGIFAARNGREFHDDTVSAGYWVSYGLRSRWYEDYYDWWVKNNNPNNENMMQYAERENEKADQETAEGFLRAYGMGNDLDMELESFRKDLSF